MQEPFDDGLTIPEVGGWAKRKYHFLGRYLEAFNTAMKDKSWTGGRHFIDLFCGAGIARIRGTSELVWSSSLLAARTTHPFTQLHLCDRDPANVDAVTQRLARLAPAQRPNLYLGDANDRIGDIVNRIPFGALCVAFVDPFGLHFDFATARILSERARADLIVLLADNMDALRNWATYYDSNPESSLDKFLGTDRWRKYFDRAADRRAQVLRELYQQQLESLGYKHFEFEAVQNSRDVDIYKLLFASKHPAGLKIWKGISRVDEGGQRKLF